MLIPPLLVIGLEDESLGLIAHIAHLHSHRIVLAVRYAEVSILISGNALLAVHQLHGGSH